MADLNKLAAEIVSLTLLEAQVLRTILKEQYGIEATPACSAITKPLDAEPGKEQEQQEFDIILKAAGAGKLAVVKVIKEVTGLGLKESKDLVEAAPKAILEGVSRTVAEEVSNKLKDAGADVEVV